MAVSLFSYSKFLLCGFIIPFSQYFPFKDEFRIMDAEQERKLPSFGEIPYTIYEVPCGW